MKERRDRSSQVVTFRIDERFYAIPSDKLLEVRAMQEPTPVSDAPPFVLGTVPFFGEALPIHDLRLQLGGGMRHKDQHPVVMVVEAAGQAFGLVVDAVCNVMPIQTRDIRPVLDVVFEGQEVVSELVIKQGRIFSLIDLSALRTVPAASRRDAAA